MPAADLNDAEVLKAQLRQEMEQVHGPLLGGAKLVAALGHANAASLQQARLRGRVPVPLFSLPQRRGFFALTRDIADWLAEARLTAAALTSRPSPAKGEPPPDQP